MPTKTCARKGLLTDFHIREESVIHRDPPEHAIPTPAPTTRIGIGLEAVGDPLTRDELLPLPLPLPYVQQAETGKITGGHPKCIPWIQRLWTTPILGVRQLKVFHGERLRNQPVEILKE